LNTLHPNQKEEARLSLTSNMKLLDSDTNSVEKREQASLPNPQAYSRLLSAKQQSDREAGSRR
jgi:hypothetical protein